MGDEPVNMLDVGLECIPPKTTAQMKRLMIRDGKPVFFKGRNLEAAETMFAMMLLPEVPPSPYEGPLKLFVEVTWPHPKKTRKADRCFVKPKTTRPDLDNWVKGLIDQLIALRFIHDDSQIAELHARKFVGPLQLAGVYLKITPADPDRWTDFDGGEL